MRSFTVRMDADNIKNAILVVGSDVTPFAKKVPSAAAVTAAGGCVINGAG